MLSDDEELNRQLREGLEAAKKARAEIRAKKKRDADGDKMLREIFGSPSVADDDDDWEEPVTSTRYTQWTTSDNQAYFPASQTKDVLPPAAYEISVSSQAGLFFSKIPIKTNNLIQFPDSNSDKVIDEIKMFWNSKELFEKHGMPFKRGIVLYGPPGSGKSSTIQFIMKDVISRKGIVLKFTEPSLFLRGYRNLREIQPDVPVVALMEDLDSILDDWSESSVLNILDGIDVVENIVFLATTNYPEKLGARIINRPSRFDKRFKIGFPSLAARKIYFEHLFRGKDIEGAEDLIEQWSSDTDEMSIAHLSELYKVVIIFKNDYDEALETLKSMTEDLSSSNDDGFRLGFEK